MDASIVQVSRRDAGAAHGIPCRSPASSMQCSQRALQARRGIPGAVSWACERMDWQGPSMPCGAVDGCVERACVCVCVCVCGGAATFFFLCSKKGKGSGARAMGKKVEGRRSAGRGREGQAGGRATGWGTDVARTRIENQQRREMSAVLSVDNGAYVGPVL